MQTPARARQCQVLRRSAKQEEGKTMQTATARISTKYQVVIPKLVREALGLRPHDSLLFVLDGSTVILRPRPDNFTAALRGLHETLWSDPGVWLEEERATWE